MTTKASTSELVRIDRAYTGAPDGTLGNPTFWLLVGVMTTLALGTTLWLRGLVPTAAIFALHTAALYAIFTVMHDAVHGVAHRNRALNGVFGRVAAFLLFGAFHSFRAVHLEHHAHTNDPERDPDLGVSRRPALLLPLHCARIFVDYRVHYYGRRMGRGGAELAEVIVVDVVLHALLVFAILLPMLRPLLTLWIGPAVLAAMLLAFAFDYLPHHPHADRGRYIDTRAVPGRWLEVLLLAQNYHLVHHLWPPIPWFRYRRAFESVRPELEARGARIGPYFSPQARPS